MPGEETAAPAAAVSVKLPDFYPSQVRVWFRQAEANFALCNITVDATKYHHVVAKLPVMVAERVLDIIDGPASDQTYAALKTRLLAAYAESDYERYSSLLDAGPLGDERPSEILDRMLAVAGAHAAACPLFRVLFLRRLPDELRTPLLDRPDDDLRELAKRADRLRQGSHRVSNMAATVTGALDDCPQGECCPVASRKGRGNKKDSAFYKWKAEFAQRQGGPCAYHAYYGTKATRCNTPCSAAPEAGNAAASRR